MGCKIIKEAIEYGSLYFLIKNNIIEHNNIKNYLLEKKDTLNLEIYDEIQNTTDKKLCLSSGTMLTDKNLKDYIGTKSHKININENIKIDKTLIFKELYDYKYDRKMILKLLKYFSSIYDLEYWHIIKNYYFNYIIKNNILY